MLRLLSLFLITLTLSAWQPEIGRITRILRKPNVLRRVSSERIESTRTIVYIVETPTKIYEAYDQRISALSASYPDLKYRKGDRVQISLPNARTIRFAPLSGGNWDSFDLESEEEK